MATGEGRVQLYTRGACHQRRSAIKRRHIMEELIHSQVRVGLYV